MSRLTRNNRLSVKPFAAVPALLDLPEILRESASVSGVSTDSCLSSTRNHIQLAEGCLITKSISYAHQVAHIINAVHEGDSAPILDVIKDLRIIPYRDFGLNDASNLIILDPVLHTSFDLYAFIALAPSYSTVSELIEMVKADNDQRQEEMDETGFDPDRSLNFRSPSFSNPEYELVSIHPEHFLPRGASLSIYDPTSSTWTRYVPSSDRYLRESVEPHSARLPPFRNPPNRVRLNRVNVFLVAINADQKFRRYYNMIERTPPPIPLPADVLALMDRVIELVELLYWVPKPHEGSRGEAEAAIRTATRRMGPGRAGRSSQPQYKETSSGEERGVEGLPGGWNVPARFTGFDWSTPMQERKAYVSSLICGHDIDYDPALFENAFPLDDAPNMYSDNATMVAWNQGVASEN